MNTEKRFTGKIRIYLTDRLFEQSMVITTDAHGSTAQDILAITEQKFKSYLPLKSIDMSEKNIREHIKGLLGDKWSNKRIINHFNKFGVDVSGYLDPQQRLPGLRGKR